MVVDFLRSSAMDGEQRLAITNARKSAFSVSEGTEKSEYAATPASAPQGYLYLT